MSPSAEVQASGFVILETDPLAFRVSELCGGGAGSNRSILSIGVSVRD